jgi:hypothetical protein
MGELILEFVESGKARRIDPGKACIYGVKLLGEHSRNSPPHNNTYPLSTRKGALNLFEGARVYVNHNDGDKQGQTRPYEQSMGVLKNIREGGDGLYGDWHFPPRHPLAANVLWDAQNAEAGLAFSINATAGKIRMSGGRKVIESLEQVHSVDLVSRGATVRSLFESLQPDRRRTPDHRRLKKLSEKWDARLDGIHEAFKKGMLNDALRTALLAADDAAEVRELLEEARAAHESRRPYAGVIVPDTIRDGRSLARWACY